jgi:hypothetical protein
VKTGLQLGFRDFSPYNAAHHALGPIITVLAADVAVNRHLWLSIVIYGGMIPGAITNTLLELWSMPGTKRDDPTELLRLALIGLDAQIAELQKTRAQLAALINQPSASPDVEAATPQKRRKLSNAARAKISAAAKARWAGERGVKAKVQKSKPAAKNAQSKAKSAKTRPATGKAKKAPAKKE